MHEYSIFAIFKMVPSESMHERIVIWFLWRFWLNLNVHVYYEGDTFLFIERDL